MLDGPEPLVVLHMPSERTQDELVHDLPQHQHQGDRPVAPRIRIRHSYPFELL